MNSMQLNAVQRMNLMRLGAALAMARVTSTLRTGAANAVSAAQTQFGRLSGVISSAGARAAFAAFGAGINISSSFARGMESALGRIRTAANAMASAASTALTAKLRIGSPSKVFMGFGGDTAIGQAIGMEQKIPEVVAAAVKMAQSIITYMRNTQVPMFGLDAVGMPNVYRPATPNPFNRPTPYSAPNTTQINNYNTTTLHVTQQPGEDGDALARRIISMLDQDEQDAS
jgi:hypothetical protein